MTKPLLSGVDADVHEPSGALARAGAPTPTSPWSVLRPVAVIFAGLTVLTGVLYPLAVTGIAQAVWPDQAAGSLVKDADGTVRGSRLIGQAFADPQYFWGRPSATSPSPHNAMGSTGANQGPTNPALMAAVKARVEALRAADPDQHEPIPQDLVTASGSGLDPHISVAAAQYQAPRVARERGLKLSRVQALVTEHIEARDFGLLGERRVNVLLLNRALDEVQAPRVRSVAQASAPASPEQAPSESAASAASAATATSH